MGPHGIKKCAPRESKERLRLCQRAQALQRAAHARHRRAGFLTYWTTRTPVALALLGLVALALVAGAIVWGFWPVRRTPSDAQVARFIEERDPSLDDRLASAVDLLVARRESEAPGLAAPMVADAARRACVVDPSSRRSSRGCGRAARRCCVLRPPHRATVVRCAVAHLVSFARRAGDHAGECPRAARRAADDSSAARRK